MPTYKVSFTDKTRAVEVQADRFRFAGGNQFIVFRARQKGGGGAAQVAAWPIERVTEIRLVPEEEK